MKSGIGRIMVEQRLLVFGQPEEPALLDRPFDRRALRRQLRAVFADDQLVFFVIGLVADRVPTLVAVEVEVPPLLHRLPDRLARAIMIGLRGADEAIVRDVKSIAHLLEKTRHFVGKCARLDAFAARCLRHLQAVLVGAGLEAHVAALAALEARDRVGGDRFIGVADVRRPVGVADRGRDVEGLGHAAAALAAACLALQGSRLGDLGEDAADLEHGRCRVERQARRDGGKLARLGIGIERALARLRRRSSRASRAISDGARSRKAA